jgi:DNA-3-methyladenine glycosylase II
VDTLSRKIVIALDRQDVVLPGDLALRKVVRTVYGSDHLPGQQEVLELAHPWRPYLSLATSCLFQAAYGLTGQ